MAAAITVMADPQARFFFLLKIKIILEFHRYNLERLKDCQREKIIQFCISVAAKAITGNR